MGLDFLDITFRLERALDIKLDWKEYFQKRCSQERDILVGEMHRFVVNEFEKQRVGSLKKPLWCRRCGARFSRAPAKGFCRVCGISSNCDDQVWGVLAGVLVQALGVKEHKITPQAALVRDLGASI